jgi:hypothetical protein
MHAKQLKTPFRTFGAGRAIRYAAIEKKND